jgi:acyl-CoA thioester hydrolase
VTLTQQGTASMRIQQQAWRDDTLLANGDIRIGCVDVGTFRPRRVPTDVLTLITPCTEPRLQPTPLHRTP